MGELNAHGVAVDVPAGWDGRIFRRPEQGDVTTSDADEPTAPPGARTHSVTHIASVALPADIADFGSDAVKQLGPDDALVVLFEYDEQSAGTALFAAQGIPRPLDPDGFSPAALQRTLPGQAGAQLFFNEGGRAFSLYVVLGAFDNRHEVVPNVNTVLETMRIEPTAGAPAPTTTTAGPVAAGTTVFDVIAGDDELTTLEELLGPTGLRETLGGIGPLTLIAPSDAAFAASGRLAALRADTSLATRTLMYHLVREGLPAATLASRPAVATVEGGELAVSSSGETVLVNGAPITRPDLTADNGVVHVLDGVLEVPA